MSSPVLLQDSFARGMRQDEARNAMLRGAVWNLVDLLPDLGAKLRKRGGTSYASGDLSGTVASATYVPMVAYTPFSGGAKLIGWTDNNHLVTIASTSSATDVGACNAPISYPVLHADKLIIPSNDGSSATKYYDGTTLGSLSGSPPAGKYAALYKDRTVLANAASNTTKAYFSDPADPTGWDTTTTYWSFGAPITGLAALPNALMVFTNTYAARLRGTTPPPGTDFIADDPLFNQGCTDARSIAVSGQYAYFANPLGVWRTNGTSIPEDLTAAAGLKRYWQNLLASYTVSGWTLAGGVYGNRYVIAVMNGSSFVDCVVFEQVGGGLRAYRLANMKGMAMANATIVGEELYIGLRSAPRVVKFSTLFSPASGVKNDADGTAVTPVLETAYFTGRPGKKWVRAVYVTHDTRDAASDNPSITVSYTTTPDGSYTALGTTLAETTDQTRSRLWMTSTAGGGVSGQGVALKLAQTNASSDTRLVALEADIEPAEPSDL